MKLFVDDERECPKGWELARDPETAIRILATRDDITDISLDHDAGDKGTFQPVAYFIGEKFNNNTFWADDLGIVIHSANPVGAKKLRDILESYGIMEIRSSQEYVY